MVADAVIQSGDRRHWPSSKHSGGDVKELYAILSGFNKLAVPSMQVNSSLVARMVGYLQKSESECDY
jgi:hypothetical protein